MRFSKKKKTLVLIAGILIILSLNFFQKEVKGFFYSFSSPIQKSFWQAGDTVSDFFEGISQRKQVQAENEELKLKLQELLAENSSLQELGKENKILREALEIGPAKEFRLTMAEVIAKDISDDTLLINIGSQDGIQKDMPVITQQKALLGKIIEIYDKFSRVRLISYKDNSFDAGITASDITGVVKGEGNLKLLLDLIPQKAPVQAGELVISSSLGGIYPKGLLVGLIKEIKKSDIGPFQQAEISPFFNIAELKDVFIILNF